MQHLRQGRQRNSLTISKVHTLRIHTFNFPGTPSTPSSSTPSHQHLLAGFLQKSNSFWAIPTALESFPAEPRTSVRKRANAREQITALLGSGARWPHVSFGWKPLLGDVSTCPKSYGVLIERGIATAKSRVKMNGTKHIPSS